MFSKVATNLRYTSQGIQEVAEAVKLRLGNHATGTWADTLISNCGQEYSGSNEPLNH